MCVAFYVRLIEDAEAKLQKAFELRSFDEVAKLRVRLIITERCWSV